MSLAVPSNRRRVGGPGKQWAKGRQNWRLRDMADTVVADTVSSCRVCWIRVVLVGMRRWGRILYHS